MRRRTAANRRRRRAIYGGGAQTRAIHRVSEWSDSPEEMLTVTPELSQLSRERERELFEMREREEEIEIWVFDKNRKQIGRAHV